MGIYIAVGACLLIGSAMLLYVVKRVIETVVFLRAAARGVALPATELCVGKTSKPKSASRWTKPIMALPA